MPIQMLPSAYLAVARIEEVDGIQSEPPFFWHTAAGHWDEQSGTGIDGRYLKHSGEVVGKSNIVHQDTYPSGTAGRTGRAMTVSGPIVSANRKVPNYDRYGIYWPSMLLGDTFEAVDVAPIAGEISHQFVVIERGIAPIGAGAANQNDIYCYLELAHNDPTGSNYRLAFPWNNPPRLDYLDPATGAWSAVDIQAELPRCETLFKDSDNQVPIHIQPDTARNIMIVEIGHGHFLRHAPARPKTSSDPNAKGTLPSTENYRFYGKNGWAGLWIAPIRYQPPTITKSARPRATPLANLANAQIIPNALGRQDGAVVSGVVAQDGDNNVAWKATAALPDAGEGQGSALPATFSDVFIYVPSVWSHPVVFPGPPSVSPVCASVREMEIFDEVTRTYSAQAKFTVDNHFGQYTGNVGNYAFNLIGSNGFASGQRLRGKIANGFKTYRQDPVRLCEFTGFDNTFTMHVPLGDEHIYDGWCTNGAVHTLLDVGQFPPQYRSLVPYWPPGPVKTGDACPFPILGSGSGNNPMYRYQPDRSVIGILLELLQDAGIPNPVTGANIPYWFGQDYNGYARFEPFDPRLFPISKVYSSNDPGGYGQILEISVFDSIDELRTELNFQGQDPYTGELLYLHFPLPWNVPYVGYRYAWFERNGRWCSEAYLNQIAQSAAILASIPSQTVYMKVPFDPNVHAGQVVYIEDMFGLGRGGFFLITMLQSQYGMEDVTGGRGEMECYSWVTARNLETLVPF